MRIQNLGPIKDISVDLNKLNIFIGKNGTGKTITAYAIYSFVYWFNNIFEVALFNMDNIKQFIRGEAYVVRKDQLLENISKNAVNQFNNLDDKYFINFFNNKGIYKQNNSRITITPNDVASLMIPKSKRQGWFYSWPYVGETSLNNVTNASNTNNVFNEIISTYNLENDTIVTYFSVAGHGRKLDEANQEAQLRSFKEESNHLKNLNIVNLSLKNVLFKFSSAYFPAERIGINVFRSDLNISRLNRSSNVNVENNKEGSLKRYPLPIEEYISYVNTRLINGRGEGTGNIFNNDLKANKMVKKLVPGNFNYHRDIDAVKYSLPNDEGEMDFELLSSSLKSIFGFDLFIKYNDQGDWMFIDEPEMNLHPSNQLVVANLTYKLFKHNIRSVISTHSDYFIKALINCVLSDRINNSEFSNNINVYEFRKDSVEKLDHVFDINESVDNFDDTTNEINAKYYELLEKINEKR
jgi:predicted ATPase